MTTDQGPRESAEQPTSDLERLAGVIKNIVAVRMDMRAAMGVSPLDPLPGPRGIYDRMLAEAEAEVRAVYANLIKDEARRWAAERPGMIELVLPEGESPSGP